jgi:DNA polymerase-1
LIEYLHCLPVTMISIDKVEADDVIAYIAQKNDDKGRKSTIVSSDKDFLQIVTKNINVYSPIKKKFYDPFMVKQDIGMLPENYLIAKSLLGDNSDNLTGVKGLGQKTMLKEFPYLVDRPGVTLDDIYETCEERIDDKKIFAKILQYKHRVDTNHELMNLQEPVLSDDQKVRILEEMREKPGMLNLGAFLHMLEQDRIEGITKNTEGWLENFRDLTKFN